jgi:uncharacterized C2H2 Zn-finger protein
MHVNKTHAWMDTGRDFTPIARKARIVQCARCGAVGFRYLPSLVVYTWANTRK